MAKYDEQYQGNLDASGATPDPAPLSAEQDANKYGEKGLRQVPIKSEVVAAGMHRATDDQLTQLFESPNVMSDPNIGPAVEDMARERGLLREAESQAPVAPAEELLPDKPEPLNIDRYLNSFNHGMDSIIRGMDKIKLSSTVQSMLETLAINPAQASTADVQMVIDDDKIDQGNTNSQLAQSVLTDPTKPAPARLEEAKEIINRKPVPKSLSEIYANRTLLLGNDQGGFAIAKAIDENVSRQNNMDVQAALIHQDPEMTWEDGADKRSEAVTAAMHELQDAVAGLFGLAGRNPETDKDVFGKLYGLEALREKYGEKLDKFTPHTPRQWLEFIDPVPYEDSMDVDALDFIKGALDDDDAAMQKWTTSMEDNYGPYWKLRFASFLTKEVGVDAGVLAFASLIPGVGPVIAGSAQSMKWGRRADVARTLLARMVAVGVGGATVNAGLKTFLGEQTSFTQDAVFRGAGYLAGEAVFRTAAAGAKGLFNAVLRTSKGFADKAGLTIRTPESMRRISSNVMATSSHYANLVRASIIKADAGKEFSRVTGGIAANLDNTADPAAGKAIQQMLNMDPDEAKTFLATAPRALDEKVFYTPEFTQAKETAATLEKGIAKMRAVRARSTKPGTIARQDAAIEAMELAKSDAEATMRGGVITTTGNQMADLILEGQAVGMRIMGEGTLPNGMNAVTTRQQDSLNLFLTYVKSDEFKFRPEVAFREGSIGSTIINGMRKATGRLFTEAEDMPYGHIAKDVFDAINEDSLMSRTFNKMFEKATTGLSRKSEQLVSDVLEEGAKSERVFNLNELIARGLSPKEIDSYYALRGTLDRVHFAYDNALVRDLGKKVDNFGKPRIMKYNNMVVQVMRNPIPGKLTQKDITEGFVYIDEVPQYSQGRFERLTQKIKESELYALDSVLPAIRGYVPIVYKDANYHLTKINLKSGAVQRVSVNKTAREAYDAQQALSKNLSDNEMIVMGRWNQREGAGEVGFFNRSHALSEFVPDQAVYQQIKENLEKAGLDENNVRIILENMDATSLRRQHVGARGADRLSNVRVEGGQVIKDDAPLLPATEAIAEYLQTTANKAGASSWRKYLVDQFINRYSSVMDPTALAQMKEGMIPFYDRKLWAGQEISAATKTVNGVAAQAKKDLVAEGKRYQDWMSRMITEKTRWERAADNLNNYMFMRLEQGNIGSRALARLFGGDSFGNTLAPLRILTGSSNTNNALRGVASIAKLGVFNLAQVIVQGSQLVATVGAHPVYATGAAGDLVKATARHLVELAGARLPRVLRTTDADQVWFALRRSGYMADLSTNDLMRYMTPNSRRLLPTVGNSLKELGQFPFKVGEATNRAMAFLTTRREYMDAATKGTLIGLDGKPFKGAIDDDEFLRLVTDKAKYLAFNMGKAGQLQGLSGPLSVLLQFKQVGFKYAEMFMTDKLSPSEKIRAAAGLMAVWGPASVPFIPDLIAGADWVHNYFVDNKPSEREILASYSREVAKDMSGFLADLTPELAQKKYGIDNAFYKRLLSKGFVNAATDGEINLASRIALGQFWSDQLTTTTSPWDIVVAVSVMHDLIDAVDNVGEAGMLNPLSYTELFTAAMGGEESYNEAFERIFEMTPKQYTGKWLREAGKAVSSIGSYASFLDNAHGEFWEGTANVYFDKRKMYPAFRALDPNEPNYFNTSSGRRTNVEATHGRLVQRLMGITPGPLDEEYSITRRENMMKSAVDEYRKSQLERFSNLPIGSEARREIMNETIRELADVRADDLFIEDGKTAMPYTVETVQMFTQARLRETGRITSKKALRE